MSVTSSGSVANSSSSGSVLGSTTPAVLGATTPSVLGATAPTILGGAAILPITGNNPLVLALVVVSMTIAVMILVSFVASRVIRKLV